MAQIRFPGGKKKIDCAAALPAITWQCGISIAGTTKSDVELPKAEGLFRIRWNNSVEHGFFPRSARIKVAYGFGGKNSKELIVQSFPEDILYIGKAQNIAERVFNIFSFTQSANSTARKIAALVEGANGNPIGQQVDGITNEELALVKSEIILDYLLIKQPLQRDFMKAYAVGTEKPCLNIGLEH